MVTDFLLIGIDGGATEVKAHAVDCANPATPAGFALRAETAARVYPRVADFVPLPVTEQLAQRERGDLNLSPAEIEQGRVWITATAETVAEVASAAGARRILVGIGMPGLKTPDGRGINALNNGPRMPAFLDTLERQLAAAGLVLVAPIAALGSDADYCGLGEEYAADGLFRDVAHAYYCGGGTGIADALKLRGQLVPFDLAKSWIQKSWQMATALGPTFEKLVSASSLNRVWSALARPAAGDCFPERAALAGDPRARTWLDAAALLLSELVFERLWTVKNGRSDAAHRGDAYTRLSASHDFRGLVLERVILGQRVGLLYADPQYRPLFAERFDAHLAAFIADAGDAELSAKCLAAAEQASLPAAPPSRLRPGFVRASRLRAAPARGAAVAAMRAARGQL